MDSELNPPSTDAQVKRTIHVVAAVIANADDQVLLALRKAGQHQGGLWEFPGGKVEPGESAREALARELEEELGIVPIEAASLHKTEHDYGDKRVALDFWQVDSYRGQPRGCEGQRTEWRAIAELNDRDFPAANRAVVALLKHRLNKLDG